MGRRDEEKRKRRQKRLERSQRPAQGPSLRRVLTELKGALEVPSPARWPGASEPALERPDDVKFEITEFLTRREPGKSKLEQLENRFLKGPLSYLPEIDHWAMEEFFYHGFPGDSWHPIEAFLAHEGDRFIPAGQEQLRRWKNARRAFRARRRPGRHGRFAGVGRPDRDGRRPAAAGHRPERRRGECLPRTAGEAYCLLPCSLGTRAGHLLCHGLRPDDGPAGRGHPRPIPRAQASRDRRPRVALEHEPVGKTDVPPPVGNAGLARLAP